MTDLDRIRDQLKRSLWGDAWHGPALLELLDGVDLAAATARPIAAAHTIAELVPHITTWIDVARRRIGGDWSPVADEENFPPAATTDREWANAVTELQAAVVRMDQMLERADAAVLERVSPDGRYTVGVMLDGVIQHNLYHAGQIALLKKGGGATG
jgi:uncharacterized damage-inducible protein DinB